MAQRLFDFSSLSAADRNDLPRVLNSGVNRFERANNLPVVSSRPLRMGIDLSRVCNVNCIFCLAENGRGKKSDLDAFAPDGWLEPLEPLLPFVEVAILSSYEAILNPWLDRHVETLARHNTPLQLFSNGKALTPELSSFLLAKGMISLWCSFHAAKEQTYQSIMRNSDYARVLENLMALKHLARGYPRFDLTMVFCAMDRNIDELPEYIDLAHAVGASVVQVNYLLVTKREHGENLNLDGEAVFFHHERYDAAIRTARRKAARLGIILNHQPAFSERQPHGGAQAPCYKPWEHMNVDRNGNILICCGGAPQMGNVMENDFYKVWNGPMLRDYRSRINTPTPPDACQRCTRGRENPWDLRTHLTYLRSMNTDALQEKLELLRQYVPNNGRITLPGAAKRPADCVLA